LWLPGAASVVVAAYYVRDILLSLQLGRKSPPSEIQSSAAGANSPGFASRFAYHRAQSAIPPISVTVHFLLCRYPSRRSHIVLTGCFFRPGCEGAAPRRPPIPPSACDMCRPAWRWWGDIPVGISTVYSGLISWKISGISAEKREVVAPPVIAGKGLHLVVRL